MSPLDLHRKKVELKRVSCAKEEFELRIHERMDEIERIREQIKISEAKEISLAEEIKEAESQK